MHPEILSSRRRFAVPTGDGWIRGSTVGSARPGAAPLLLLHGGPGVPSDYLEPLAGLADERLVILYDQIGCGLSEPARDDSAWQLDRFVHRLELVRQHLGVTGFHVLGHAWGGMLALAYADRYPERVRSLLMASPLVDAEAWSEDAASLVAALPPRHREALRAGPRHPGFATARAEYTRRHYCRSIPRPEPLKRAMTHRGDASQRVMWGASDFAPTGTLRGVSCTDAVRRLDMPSLWLGGGDDEVRPTTLKRFASMAPKSSLAVFPGGTHMVHLEQVAQYRAVLRKYLRMVEPRKARKARA
ncbi:proline iminopeptidase-family hydrolase [Agromyces archimandritae]|uniref:Proline iminopeptidase n=1 Tax=Agromyces archimandritae TaxID=2781962 RepID=A0A975FL05_9MICO|nr:proline iminopeptidase-family hydrolase [Agromyces archimandritae]QTX04030.1 proline iminopeptidase-family hydrolase [Agromyces archimandritae]